MIDFPLAASGLAGAVQLAALEALMSNFHRLPSMSPA